MNIGLVSSVLDWIEGHPAAVITEGGVESRTPVNLETAPADGSTALMLRTLAASKIVRRYKSGGYIARYEFAVWLRVGARDTAARLEAMRVLMEMGASIDDRSTWPTEPEGMSWVSFSVQSLPAPVFVASDGTEDYQVSFELTYAKG